MKGPRPQWNSSSCSDCVVGPDRGNPPHPQFTVSALSPWDEARSSVVFKRRVRHAVDASLNRLTGSVRQGIFLPESSFSADSLTYGVRICILRVQSRVQSHVLTLNRALKILTENVMGGAEFEDVCSVTGILMLRQQLHNWKVCACAILHAQFSEKHGVLLLYRHLRTSVNVPSSAPRGRSLRMQKSRSSSAEEPQISKILFF